MDKKSTDRIETLATALIADLQTLLRQPPRLASLADLRAAAPRATADAVQAAAGEIRTTIASVEEQQQARRKALAEALENDAARRIEQIKQADIRPAPAPREGRYVVIGRLTDKKSGVGLPNVAINLFDLDRTQDDLLGSTRTDDHGYYRFEYTERQVDDRADRKAEIYLQVLDETGAVLHQTPRSFFDKAGPVYELDAVIDGAKLPRNLELARAVALLREKEILRYTVKKER